MVQMVLGELGSSHRGVPGPSYAGVFELRLSLGSFMSMRSHPLSPG
jgi:hypothetical protein